MGRWVLSCPAVRHPLTIRPERRRRRSGQLVGSTDRELMSDADVARTVSRIAHQIIEKTALDAPDSPRVVLLGIPTRGVTLAKRLAAKIDEFAGVTVERGSLDITLYRDDLDSKPP